jgi:hypothetical protein
MRTPVRIALLLLTSTWLTACVSSYVLVGTPRLPIPTSAVSVFVQAPAARYEEIAILETSSARSVALTPQGRIDTVIRRLKSAAAKLGANGIVVHALADGAPAAIGAGFGLGLVGTHGTVGFSVGGSGETSGKIGRATAIYLPAPPTAPPPATMTP